MNEALPKILIVDDKPNNLYALRRVLSHLKIEVIEADSGQNALIQVMNHDFFLVLLDVNMPEMDGFETADLMLSNKTSESTPIIFLTAINRDLNFAIRGYLTGAVDYIYKPFNDEVLIGKVKIFKQLWEQKKMLVERNNDLKHLANQLAQASKNYIHDSLHDSLTGVPNRKLLLDRGKLGIAIAERAKGSVCLVMLDLDGFKAINDKLGHLAGDMVLQEVCSRMTARLRSSDTLARIGGDEFCFILNETTGAQAAQVIESLVEIFDLPIVIEDKEVTVGGSFGVAEYPIHGKEIGDLLRKADLAMYEAKRSQKTFTVYEESIDSKNELTINKRAELITAVKENQLEIYYQPQVDSNNQCAPGLEALVRWNHPDRGMVLPLDFIPFAEKNNLISLITRWVVEKAIKQCSSWIRAGRITNVSINVSPHDFSDSRVLDFQWIVQLMRNWSMPRDSLVLEVTENILMNSSPRLEEQMQNLNENGIELSLDDFGTGYSSLTYLHQIPVKEVKIDQSFVSKLDSKNKFVIVKSIIDLGHNLGLRVVAEGVETESHLITLKGLGCDRLQGYYFCKPQPAEQIDLWLQSYYATYSGAWQPKDINHR